MSTFTKYVTRKGLLLSVAFPLCLIWTVFQPTGLQGQVSNLRLGPATLVVGQSGDVELHRVTGAAVLPNGHLAIADAGNYRIVVVDTNGRPVRTFGRSGDGPGEMRTISRITAFHDTLVVFDGQLQRVSVWHSVAGLLRTSPLPQYQESGMDVQVMLSPDVFVTTSRIMTPSQARDGVRVEQATLLRVTAGVGTVSVFDRLNWRRVIQESGSGGGTVYAPPILGQTVMAAAGGRIALIPIDSTVALISVPGEPGRRRVELPVPSRPFTRSVMSAYRDSIIATIPSGYPQIIANFRNAFSDDLPLPPRLPAVLQARSVGPNVWLQTIPGPGETVVAWYVLDMATQRIVGRYLLPHGWNVLGGSPDSVIILQRSELDIEYVTVYSLPS